MTLSNCHFNIIETINQQLNNAISLTDNQSLEEAVARGIKLHRIEEIERNWFK